MKIQTTLLPVFIVLQLCILKSCDDNNSKRNTPQETMNIEIIKRFTVAMNNVEYDTFKEIIDSAATWHYRGKEMPNTPESERNIQSYWKSALPDMNYGIEKIIARGDEVVVLYTYTGTHEDTLLGYPPTSNTISVNEMVIYKLKDQRIVETWVVFDEHLLRRQLKGKEGNN
jgi:predicted ester cyclase